MKYKVISVFLAIFLVFGKSFSQELSSKEKKTLKKEIRKLLKEPIKYKYLKESLAVKESIVKEQTAEIDNMTRNENLLKHKLKVARDSIGDFSYALDLYKKEEKNASTKCCNDDSGMRYRLQIGLYKEFDISSFLEQLKLMSYEITEDGLYRYTIGNFATEDEAEVFKEAMRQMGIKDAFVSFYLDGKRIPKDL